MRPTAALHEVMKMKFDNVFDRCSRGTLSMDEAAEILGCSVSTFFRKRRRYEQEGEAGLVDRRIGKVSAKCVPVDEVMRIISLYETDYYDFTVKHFHEKLQQNNVQRSYTFVKNTLQNSGVVKKAKKRGQHRRKRARRPQIGMMLHQDGSQHEWVPGTSWDLIVTMDDADSECYSMFFCEEEGTMSTFLGLSETFTKHGLPCSLYIDRASHYFTTLKAGEKVDKVRVTQVGRAMKQLGIEMIPAYSPQARGRSERMFGTLQNRLPQELRLRGITDMAEANRFLREEFLPEHNARFAQPAESNESAFSPLNGFILDDILCIQEERVVGNDNTVRYKGHTLQLACDAYRLHYVKAKVRVHEYPDGSLAVFHGPRKLATTLLAEKNNKEAEYSDAFIAFVPHSVGANAKGEVSTSPYPDSGNHHGARVTRQCCPIPRMAQSISAEASIT